MTEGSRIAVTRASLPPFEEYCREIAPLWESRMVSNGGSKHAELESALRTYLGVDHLELFVNGHTALECALEALELGVDGRDEVITTPFTFASTVHAIVRKGLRPVFCDIRPDDFTVDTAKVEACITPRTCAIVPVHVFGNVCDVEGIARIADAHGLKVVYDAAHAFGVTVDGVGVGSFGDVTMFSFHATKVFNTVEGGALCFRDEALAGTFAMLRNFGIEGPESVRLCGTNAKMHEFSAAMGICNLRHIDEYVTLRKVLHGRYAELLADVPGIRHPVFRQDIRPNYAYFPVLVDPDLFGATRDVVHDALATQGIGARKYFFPLASDYECYRGMFDSGDTPVAQRVASQVLCLPLHPDLSFEDVEHVCGVIRSSARRV